MNEEKLIWGAGFIDDDLVSEAIDYKPRRIRLAPWACAAAAAVVLVTAIAVIARQLGKPPVLPPDSSGIVASTGLPQYTTDPEYTAGTGNWSLPNNPPDYSKSPNNSTDTSMSTVTTVDIDPEPQPVDIGNGMTLVGTPLDASKLEEYPITFDSSAWALDDLAEEFIDSLEIPELKDLVGRTLRLTCYCLSPISVPWAPSVQPTDGGEPPYIQSADGIRYYETGYTYESFYNEYLRTFTKETLEEMFQKYDVFLDYNCELFCSDGARGGWLGEVHREYELISKSNTFIEFRRLIFRKDSQDKPAAEYVPELRNEYDLGITDFKFLKTDSGWRAWNIPVEYETDPSYLSPNHDYSVNRVYPDDEQVPSDWLRVASHAEAMDKFDEIIKADTSATEPKGTLTALMNRSVLCYALFFGVSRDILNIDWDSPYYYPDFENPIYPFSTEYFTDTQTIFDLAYATYERSVAEKLLYGVWDLSDEPRYVEENGQMYINNNAFPAGAGGYPAFIARSYVEITEKTDKKCTFIWHYPDVERLNPPKSGYEFFYYNKTYTAEYIDGAWKLNSIITNIP